MSSLNLKGLWIPIEILTDKNLSDKEKHIYSLVIFLSQEKQYCFCTNKTISKLLNISVTQVSKLVNSLKDKGYINIEMVYKEPPINYTLDIKKGVAVPFYKIYVKLSDLPERNPEIETNNGLLYSYGAYYVCAIHPDYITLTDDYIQFNGE